MLIFDEPSHFVSSEKLNFIFTGIKILEKEETWYRDSLIKHSRYKILRYYIQTKT